MKNIPDADTGNKLKRAHHCIIPFLCDDSGSHTVVTHLRGTSHVGVWSFEIPICPTQVCVPGRCVFFTFQNRLESHLKPRFLSVLARFEVYFFLTVPRRCENFIIFGQLSHVGVCPTQVCFLHLPKMPNCPTWVCVPRRCVTTVTFQVVAHF